MEQNQNETLGSYLKNLRESKKISLEQIAYATRISLKMLRALEEDDQTTLPAPTFVRGYLQAYAKYVKAEPQDFLQRYQALLANAPDQKGAIKSHYLYVRERYQEKRRLVMVIVLFATMLSVAGTYFLLKAKRERNKETAKKAEELLTPKSESSSVAVSITTQTSSGSHSATATATEDKKATLSASSLATEVAPTTSSATVTSTKTTTATATATTTKTNTATATKSNTTTATQTSTASTTDTSKDEKKAYNLLLKAEVDVWLRFQTDSNEVRDLTLRSGKAIMLRGDKVIKIFSGNLNALKGTLNGAPLSRLTSDPKAKSAVIPESESGNYPLPLFPQFQTPSAKSNSGDGDKKESD